MQFAVSIVTSGGYEDDEDQGDNLTFTGAGGNDLLGRKVQIGAQTLTGPNAALACHWLSPK